MGALASRFSHLQTQSRVLICYDLTKSRQVSRVAWVEQRLQSRHLWRRTLVDYEGWYLEERVTILIRSIISCSVTRTRCRPEVRRKFSDSIDLT